MQISLRAICRAQMKIKRIELKVEKGGRVLSCKGGKEKSLKPSFS
tara:strand:+ start:810 stop:944 length:135 start_codon:yes stop_codon:yes gene_type:complete